MPAAESRRRTPSGLRAFALTSLTAALIGCRAGQNNATPETTLVAEADSLRCGTTATLYTNHTIHSRHLQVRVTNGCTAPAESMAPPPARLVVLDPRNNVILGQDIQILAGVTHLGTVTVQGGTRLQLEASTPGVGHGAWSYRYALP